LESSCELAVRHLLQNERGVTRAYLHAVYDTWVVVVVVVVVKNRSGCFGGI